MNWRGNDFSDRLGIALRQVRAMTAANLKTRYRGTWSGMVWVIINPLIIFGAQAYLFRVVLQIRIDHYLLFLISGLLPWIFISQTLEMTATLLSNHGPLLKSFPIHPLVLILAQVLDNLINFSIAFVVLLLPVLLMDRQFLARALLLPGPIFILVLGVVSLCALIAMAQVFLHDTRFVIGFITTVTFYLTPISYTAAMVPPDLRWVLKLNLFYYLIEPFHEVFVEGPGGHFGQTLGTAALTSAIFAMAAFWFWKRFMHALYFRL